MSAVLAAGLGPVYLGQGGIFKKWLTWSQETHAAQNDLNDFRFFSQMTHEKESYKPITLSESKTYNFHHTNQGQVSR